jgi:protein TonB
MNNTGLYRAGRVRLVIFAAVAALHAVLIMVVAFRIDTVISPPAPMAGVMRLLDVEERPPPPPPPEKPPDAPVTTTQEAVAEIMIETEEEPPPVTAAIPLPLPAPRPEAPAQIDFLRLHEVTRGAVLPEAEIARNLVYPPIAQRSNIEGVVILELFVDRQGNIREVRIQRENPPGRGFGEAAVNAFKGIRAQPAEAGGVTVATRFRYDIRFVLK